MAFFNRFKGITFRKMSELSEPEARVVVEKCGHGSISLQDGRMPFLRGVVAFRGGEPIAFSGLRTEHIESGQYGFNHAKINPRKAMGLVSECMRRIDPQSLGGRLRFPRRSKGPAARIFRRRSPK